MFLRDVPGTFYLLTQLADIGLYLGLVWNVPWTFLITRFIDVSMGRPWNVLQKRSRDVKTERFVNVSAKRFRYVPCMLSSGGHSAMYGT